MPIERTINSPSTIHERGVELLRNARNGPALPGGVATPIVFCKQAAEDPVQAPGLAQAVAQPRPNADAGARKATACAGIAPSVMRMVTPLFFMSAFLANGVTAAMAQPPGVPAAVFAVGGVAALMHYGAMNAFMGDVHSLAAEFGPPPDTSVLADLTADLRAMGNTHFVVVPRNADSARYAAAMLEGAARSGDVAAHYGDYTPGLNAEAENRYQDYMADTFKTPTADHGFSWSPNEGAEHGHVEFLPMGTQPQSVDVRHFSGEVASEGATSFALVKGALAVCEPAGPDTASCPPLVSREPVPHEMLARGAGMPAEAVRATLGAFPLALAENRNVTLVNVGTTGEMLAIEKVSADFCMALTVLPVGSTLYRAVAMAGCLAGRAFLETSPGGSEAAVAHSYVEEGMVSMTIQRPGQPALMFVSLPEFAPVFQKFAQANPGVSVRMPLAAPTEPQVEQHVEL